MQLQHQFHFQTSAMILLSLGLGLILCEHPAIFLDSSESQIGFVIGMDTLDTLDSVHWTRWTPNRSGFHFQLSREASEVVFELVSQLPFRFHVVLFGRGEGGGGGLLPHRHFTTANSLKEHTEILQLSAQRQLFLASLF